ncbi:hydroxyurea phosphotransferase [Streptomyces sp. DSM 110735]|uniref:aminoglycoside phosphotransferase family protein n=1 Tax=Streptomyces sp. DSM 110735 TaxID=2775031 RepID=UPI0018F6E37A|nr:aminoglycoside phosphotransferase family protein [Streptomyces sp. DSM 110735]MBJ7905990.1 hydroxyurea phosphotransferase [Streptomyces sp. DSM 110735]
MVARVTVLPDEPEPREDLRQRTVRFLRRWHLRADGAARSGTSSLVTPVTAPDGTPAALKVQHLDAECAGEATALRAWSGDGAVRLLRDDPPTATLLLERCDATRPLTTLPDPRAAVTVLATLLTRLTSRPAPPGLRHLGDIAHGMLERTSWALRAEPDPAVRALLRDCAAALREVADEPGDRLLHWDLHYGNVLAADRAPWLAIDPKPLSGDPGFELLPALVNRYDPADTLHRFDSLTATLALDRERARAWTLARVLQNRLWQLTDPTAPRPVPDPRLEVGAALRHR